MSDETTVPPALTAEEWKRAAADEFQRGDIDISQDGAGVYVSDLSPDGGSVWVLPYIRPALAALALYGQPFGFTRDDLDDLALAADVLENDVNLKANAECIRKLRARIAALLPPEG